VKPQQPLSILLVEDDENSCEILASMLAMGFPDANIYSAGDGKTGLEYFRRELPDIVITDINMPEMDGITMLGRISAINPDVRVFVVTAHSDRQYLEKIGSTGVAVELLSKPIDFEYLFAAIKGCLPSLSRAC